MLKVREYYMQGRHIFTQSGDKTRFWEDSWLLETPLSHPVLEGKPNANHVRVRISYSRTQQLHNMDIITQCSK
jgi:hypothetical protein